MKQITDKCHDSGTTDKFLPRKNITECNVYDAQHKSSLKNTLHFVMIRDITNIVKSQ